MDDLTAPRIEPLGTSVDHDRPSLKQGPPRRREAKEKNAPPSPRVESDDPAEEIHQIDELA